MKFLEIENELINLKEISLVSPGDTLNECSMLIGGTPFVVKTGMGKILKELKKMYVLHELPSHEFIVLDRIICIEREKDLTRIWFISEDEEGFEFDLSEEDHEKLLHSLSAFTVNVEDVEEDEDGKRVNESLKGAKSRKEIEDDWDFDEGF